jgi:hypothetical protein
MIERCPPIPQNIAAIIIPPAFQLSHEGMQFFVQAGHHNEFLMFATHENLRELVSAQEVFYGWNI